MNEAQGARVAHFIPKWLVSLGARPDTSERGCVCKVKIGCAVSDKTRCDLNFHCNRNRI